MLLEDVDGNVSNWRLKASETLSDGCCSESESGMTPSAGPLKCWPPHRLVYCLDSLPDVPHALVGFSARVLPQTRYFACEVVRGYTLAAVDVLQMNGRTLELSAGPPRLLRGALRRSAYLCYKSNGCLRDFAISICMQGF